MATMTTPSVLFEEAVRKALEKEVQAGIDKLIEDTISKARLKMQKQFAGAAVRLSKNVSMYYNHTTLRLELSVPEDWGVSNE